MLFAILAGVFGALSSFASKVAMAGGFTLEAAAWPLERLGALAAFIGSNVLMMLAFKNALEKTDSAAATLAVNMAANFLFTVLTLVFKRFDINFKALAGWLYFEERLNHTWWLGAALIIGGAVILEDNNRTSIKQKRK